MAFVSGWGRSTWGSGTWGEASAVTLTGLGATTALGTISVTADANVAETGVAATGAVGSQTVTGTSNLSLTSGLKGSPKV